MPVSADGVADIALKGDGGPQTTQAIELMLAQFAWTLRQEPAIRALRMSIGGQQIQLPGGVSEVSVDQGAAYDPTGFQASSLLYGLRDGLLVSGTAGALDAVDGPFGEQRLRPPLDRGQPRRDPGGRGVRRRPHGAAGAGPRAGRDVRQVVSGATDLLRPAWDFADRLWLVDRTPGGARVVLRQPRPPRCRWTCPG